MSTDTIKDIIIVLVPAVLTLIGALATGSMSRRQAVDAARVAPYEQMAARLEKVEKRSDDQDEQIAAQQKIISEQGERLLRLEHRDNRWEGFYSWLVEGWHVIRQQPSAPAHPQREHPMYDKYREDTSDVD